MRIIYKILIGMLIFNGVYLALAPAFDTASFSADDPTNMTNPAFEENPVKYQSIGGIDLGTMLITGVGVFVGAAVLGLISFGGISISLGTIIGTSTIVAILAGLWRGMSGVFEPMLAWGGDIASSFYTIFIVVFGILIALTIAEMFGGQSGVDN